jgi:hypothetical protein
MEQNMAGDQQKCIECGAALGEAAACEELFHTALGMETIIPRAAAAHHLLVATYMLQHPSHYTPEGQAAFASLVRTAVDEALSAQELRERNRGRFDQNQRNWRFRTAEGAEPQLREWQMTIADVINGPVEELPERVWTWVRYVRAETDKQATSRT